MVVKSDCCAAFLARVRTLSGLLSCRGHIVLLQKWCRMADLSRDGGAVRGYQQVNVAQASPKSRDSEMFLKGKSQSLLGFLSKLWRFNDFRLR